MPSETINLPSLSLSNGEYASLEIKQVKLRLTMTSRAAERKRTSVQTLNVLGFPCKLNPTVQCPTAHISKISKKKYSKKLEQFNKITEFSKKLTNFS